MLAVFILNVILDTQWRAYDVWPGLSWVMHGIGGFVVAWSTVRWYDRLPTSARPRVGPPAAAANAVPPPPAPDATMEPASPEGVPVQDQAFETAPAGEQPAEAAPEEEGL